MYLDIAGVIIISGCVVVLRATVSIVLYTIFSRPVGSVYIRQDICDIASYREELLKPHLNQYRFHRGLSVTGVSVITAADTLTSMQSSRVLSLSGEPP